MAGEPQQDRGTATREVLETWNGEPVEATDVPILPLERFRRVVIGALCAGARLSGDDLIWR